MVEPFIRNHHYNFIKKQMQIVQHASNTVPDPTIIQAVKDSAQSKVIEIFSDVPDAQKQIVARISALKTVEEFQEYLSSLVPYLAEFPQVTEKQVKKLFPKNKKLKMPDLATTNFRPLTYLGWIDISTNKWFMVYDLDGNVVGVEGKFTLTNKKDMCSLCKGYGEVALVSAISKSRASHSPDYYKAVGNYMCMNSLECNKNITNVADLERFIHNVIG
ncbi:FusB/FusC family EF-G-binding protein [Aneurinibacillus sp. Ricciae_BoGa-3]|uniref:FusB/FusC family EF-G-binding protein n=1 Tax=Aneurinibacillus sp. Ricciae_BoGa-3 TaxID=3022697 RepID=UPI002340E5A2|nr:FusB/FusC family EF-G-binding protein [Aneurinibacillus sp. Ricciae_BoGa-3]WCK54101.1 FusB/FusC family EF-G-binding protein [Aneurinibacillus sp. Ricciae_BoGa-3]